MLFCPILHEKNELKLHSNETHLLLFLCSDEFAFDLIIKAGRGAALSIQLHLSVKRSISLR